MTKYSSTVMKSWLGKTHVHKSFFLQAPNITITAITRKQWFTKIFKIIVFEYLRSEGSPRECPTGHLLCLSS